MVKAKSSKPKKRFFGLEERLHKLAKTMGVLIFLLPIVITGIIKFVPYMHFIYTGPELVKNVETLKTSVLVLTGAFKANVASIDSTTYKVNWKEHEYTVTIKVMFSGDTYAFVKDGEIGEQIFVVNYHRDTREWYFIDFSGNYIKLEKK
jgi:TRAP-type mannitol/chloroaromatic compound transport system permease small subunit